MTARPQMYMHKMPVSCCEVFWCTSNYDFYNNLFINTKTLKSTFIKRLIRNVAHKEAEELIMLELKLSEVEMIIQET